MCEPRKTTKVMNCPAPGTEGVRRPIDGATDRPGRAQWRAEFNLIDIVKMGGR